MATDQAASLGSETDGELSVADRSYFVSPFVDFLLVFLLVLAVAMTSVVFIVP